MDGRAQHTTAVDAAVTAVAAAAAGAAHAPATLGDYVLGARLTRRPAADVYDATHVPSGAPRLVYVLRPGAMQNHPLVHRVVCEVDAARWLRHPTVAKVDGYGDTPSGRLYVAVEQPPGRPLGEVLAENGRMPPWRVVRLACRLVEALDEAHAVGLVHGRLTPASVVVADESDAAGNPIVTLVGLGAAAVALDGEVAPHDRPYVSPEQLAGGEPDARSDVFGLASLLHHALVGASPSEPGAADRGHAGSAGDVGPGPMAEVIAAARAPDPAHRPGGVKAFWEDLLAALVLDADAHAGAPRATAAVASGARAGHTSISQPALDPVGFEHLGLDLDVITPLDVPADLDSAASAPGAAQPVSTSAAAPTPELSFGGVVWAGSPQPVHAPPANTGWPPPGLPALTPLSAVPARRTWPEERRRVVASPPSVVAPPARRKRALSAHAWWLAVPIAAAAVGWPLASDTTYSRDRQTMEAAAEVSTLSDELPTVEYRVASQAGTAERDSTPAAAALPAPPKLNIPVIELPAVEQVRRPVVRADEFAGGITPTGDTR